MSAIMDIAAALASGQINLSQARESIRQIRPAPYEHSDPWVLDTVFTPDGGLVELHAAAMVHDLTAEEHEALRSSLMAHPVGDPSQIVDYSSPAGGKEAGGTPPGTDLSGEGPASLEDDGEGGEGGISLKELLEPYPEEDGLQRVFAPESDVPREDDDNPPIFGEPEWGKRKTPPSDRLKKSLLESIFKHFPGRHPQERHAGDHPDLSPKRLEAGGYGPDHDFSDVGGYYMGGSNRDQNAGKPMRPTPGRKWPRRHADLARRYQRAKTKHRLRFVIDPKKPGYKEQFDLVTPLVKEFTTSELKVIARYETGLDVRYVEEALARKKKAADGLAKHYPGGEDHPQERHGDREGAGGGDAGGDEKASAGERKKPPPGIMDLNVLGDAAREGLRRLNQPEPEVPQPESNKGTGRRPKTFDSISGQDRAVRILRDMVKGSKALGEQVPHTLFTGPAGVGKTTLANVLANEMGVNVKTITGPNLKAMELKRELSRLQEGDVLFIDEIHAIPKDVQEILYPVMEDFEMDFETKEGYQRKKLPQFTLVGATTDPQGLLHPLRERFTGGDVELSYLEDEHLAEVVKRSAKRDGFGVSDEIALDIAGRSRGVPRAANKIYDNARRTAAAMGLSEITAESLKSTYESREIDSVGLTKDDRAVLQVLARQSRPIGLSSLAEQANSLPKGEVQSAIEPFLLRLELIERTGSGRVITEKGRQHLQSTEFNKSFRIVKSDKSKNLIFGWANVAFDGGSQVEDHQGHLIDVDDLESGAYNFVVKYRSSGDEHTEEAFGELVESVVVTPEKIEKGGFPPDMLGKWWVGFKLPPDQWAKVQAGDRSMFSIQGKARLEPLD